MVNAPLISIQHMCLHLLLSYAMIASALSTSAVLQAEARPAKAASGPFPLVVQISLPHNQQSSMRHEELLMDAWISRLCQSSNFGLAAADFRIRAVDRHRRGLL